MENILTTGFDIWILIKALALIILGMYLVCLCDYTAGKAHDEHFAFRF